MPLNIEVVAIGNEILAGFTINSNAAAIGQALLSIGLNVTAQRTLPDSRERLLEGLRDSIDQNDLVICSGGLGPTCDDNTRQIIADLFDCELEFEEKVAEHLDRNFIGKKIAREDQSMIPTKAEYILNELGTAPALVFNEHNTLVLFLPGVPSELKHFLHKDVLKIIKQKFPDEHTEFRQQCYFFQLGESQIDPTIRELNQKYPQIDFGIYPRLGLLSIHIISSLPTDQENLDYQAPIKRQLIEQYKENFYSDKENKLEKIVWDKCRANNLTVCLEENSHYLNLSSRLGPVLDNDGELIVSLNGIPDMAEEEEVYTGEINIQVKVRDQTPNSASFNLRGNREMFSKRCEHMALAEMFKALNTL